MDRNLNDRKGVGVGMVDLDFSFACNNTSSPLMSTLRGADASWVESLTRTGVGVILVTLKLEARCRYLVAIDATLQDLNASDDGAYATIGAVQNEGSSSAKMTFNVYTRAAAGTKTDYASPRRCSVSILAKNSTVGV